MAVNAGLLGSRRPFGPSPVGLLGCSHAWLAWLLVSMPVLSCPGLPAVLPGRKKKRGTQSCCCPSPCLGGKRGPRLPRVEGANLRLSCSTVGRPHRTVGRWDRERHDRPSRPWRTTALQYSYDGQQKEKGGSAHWLPEAGADRLTSRSQCHVVDLAAVAPDVSCPLPSSHWNRAPPFVICRQPSSQGWLYPVREVTGLPWQFGWDGGWDGCWRRPDGSRQTGGRVDRQADGKADCQKDSCARGWQTTSQGVSE